MNLAAQHSADVARVAELRKEITMRCAAGRHLRGLPARHNEQAIAAARDLLGTLEFLATLAADER